MYGVKGLQAYIRKVTVFVLYLSDITEALRDLEINSDVLGANIAIHLLAMG
jgi:hypothetical protein